MKTRPEFDLATIGLPARPVLVEALEPLTPADAKTPQLLIISAKTDEALEQETHELRKFLVRGESLRMSDIAYTLQIGRKACAYRRMLVCIDREDGIAALSVPDDKRVLSNHTDNSARPVVFLLPGVGDQYVGMAHNLYATWNVFRQEVDRCAQILHRHMGIDVRSILYPSNLNWKKSDKSRGIDFKRMLARNSDQAEDPDTNILNTTLSAQPVLFTIEYAMCRLWQSLGITPDAIVGHSMGEYVAACLAGVFSLDDALRLIATRAMLVNELPLGAMLSVLLPEDELRRLLPADLVLSLINAPNHCVIAGSGTAVTEFERLLTARNIISRRVRNGHAFHSRLMDPIVDAFKVAVSRVELSEPRIPYVSNVTGDWITAAQATDPAYWAKHLNHTARFSDALHHMWQLNNPILLECGPGRTLSVLAAQHPDSRGSVRYGSIWSIRQHYENTADEEMLLHAIGKLWLSGAPIRWEGIQPRYTRRRLSEQEWGAHIFHATKVKELTSETPDNAAGDSGIPSTHLPSDPHLGPGSFVAPRSELEISLARACERVLGVARVGITDNFFELGGHSLAVIRLIVEMKQTTGLEINPGEVFRSPTIAELVLNMGMEAQKNASLVVPLQPNGTQVPIFCICGLDIYKEFAQSVGENQPVFGVFVDEERAIIDKVLTGESRGVSIQRLVDAYDEAIARFCPRGPYRLAGISFGGILATALAYKMRERGAQVDVVFLFDTLLPQGRRRIWVKWFIKKLTELTTTLRHGSFERLYATLRKGIVGRTEAAGSSFDTKPLRLDRTTFYRQFEQRQRAAFSAASKHWQVQGSAADFRVVLFRAAVQDMWGRELKFAEDYGWRRYLGDKLSVVNVPGGHLSILKTPHVGELARQAQRFLRSEPTQSSKMPNDRRAAS